MTAALRHQKRHLECPCGELLIAETEELLVEMALRHLAEAHPGRTYTRAEILFMAF